MVANKKDIQKMLGSLLAGGDTLSSSVVSNIIGDVAYFIPETVSPLELLPLLKSESTQVRLAALVMLQLAEATTGVEDELHLLKLDPNVEVRKAASYLIDNILSWQLGQPTIKG